MPMVGRTLGNHSIRAKLDGERGLVCKAEGIRLDLSVALRLRGLARGEA